MQENTPKTPPKTHQEIYTYMTTLELANALSELKNDLDSMENQLFKQRMHIDKIYQILNSTSTQLLTVINALDRVVTHTNTPLDDIKL